MALGNYIVKDLEVDISHLSKRERKCLEYLTKAAQPIDTIYWKQKSEYGLAIKNFIEKAIRHAEPKAKPLFKEYLDYLAFNCSFYDGLSNGKKFFPHFSREDLRNAVERVPSEEKKQLRQELDSLLKPIFSRSICPEKPEGVNIYDKGVTKIMLEKASKDKKLGKKVYRLNTEIRRDKGKIKVVPYEKVHKAELEEASSYLIKASKYASGTFKRYLLSRSKALLDGKYRKSDEDWIDVKGNLNVVIGPIETYIDGILGQKAAYEAMVYVKDAEETAKLARLKSLATQFEKNLPCSDKYKKEKVFIPPLEVVQTILNRGEAGDIFTAIAWILPNDEKIRKEKGYRIAFSKNVQRAKSGPDALIAERLLGDKEFKLYGKSTDDGYFLFCLLHEFSHANGKVRDGLKLTPQEALKEHYSTIEEAKADIVGLYHLDFLKSKGFITEHEKEIAYYAYFVNSFRKFKTGLKEAHARGHALFFNYLKEREGIKVKNSHYSMDMKKATEAVGSLAQKLLTINGEGDYNEANKLLKKYAFISPETKKALAKIKDLPVPLIRHPKLKL